MSTANATVIDNCRASATIPTWYKNIAVIPPPEAPSSKPSEAAVAQSNIQQLDITSEELAILDKLTATPSGTWFEYKINGYKKSRHIKFSWYSPTTRSYIFVGPNGMQIACLSEHTLAHDLYIGNARILEHTRSSFIRHVLNTVRSTLNKLRAQSIPQQVSTRVQSTMPKQWEEQK